MIKLLPCPFCGGPASIVKNSFPPRNRLRHPSCDNDDCPGHVAEQDEQGGTNCDVFTDEAAAELWNKRTPTHVAYVKALSRIRDLVDGAEMGFALDIKNECEAALADFADGDWTLVAQMTTGVRQEVSLWPLGYEKDLRKQVHVCELGDILLVYRLKK